MNNNLSKKHRKLQNAAFAFAMAAAAVFLLWKCRYGFANKDESLYLAIPYRFWQGDGMFVDEWNLSQFSSFLLMPFLYAYMAIAKTTEGILLCFRYIFTVVQGLTAVLLYSKLKRYNWLGAFVAALTFFIYTPFGIMALSYNSMGIQCMAVATVMLLTNDKQSKAVYIVSGVLFAAAVLCCPYLVAVYAVYSLLVLINVVRKGCFELDVLQIKCWLWITVGVAGLAALFLAFVLSRASIFEMLVALQWMLNDPQHQSQSFVQIVTSYFEQIFKCNSFSPVVYALYTALLVIYKFTGNKIDRALFFCGAAMITGIFMVPFVTWNFYINSVMFPVNILGFFCVFLTDNLTVKRLFKVVWLPGMMYGFCIHMASTEGFLNIASTSTVSLMASIVIVILTGKEVLEKSNINWLRLLTLCAVSAVLVMQLVCTAYARYISVFWESGWFGAGMPAQTQLMGESAQKGILVSTEKEELYNTFLEDTKPLREEIKPQNVLYMSQNTWLYLVSEDMRTASFSAWLPGVDMEQFGHTVERLYSYYEINPDKLPQAVYAEAQYHQFAQEFADKYGYTETETQHGNYLYTK